MICVGICTFSTNVKGTEITDFYTPIDQSTNKPIYTPVELEVDVTNFQSIMQKHIFQKGDVIIFNPILRESGSESSLDTQFDGFLNS